jgi:hypothetical protein
MPTDPLDPILGSAGVTRSRLQRAELEAVCHGVSTVPPEEFIEAVTRAPGLSWDDGQSRPAGYFEIHDRHWWLDVIDPGNRRYLLTVVTAAVLVDALHLTPSIGWVTRVLPTAIVVRSASRDDMGLHLDLLRRAATGPLPPHLADTVNPDDYAEFTSVVAGAAPVLAIPAGGTVSFTGP